MAGTESVRPLPPLNPPPSKQTGSFAAAESGSDARRAPSSSSYGAEVPSRPEEFDTEAFDLAETNTAMRRGLPNWRG